MSKNAIFGTIIRLKMLTANIKNTPFGTILDGRKFGNSTRIGFNSQERDDEISGIGNHSTAMFWEYDSRLGKRWNMDPIIKPWESSYATFGGNPILFSDPNGDDIKTPRGKEGREVRKDIKFLRKNDAAFNERWKALEKQYAGKKDLNIRRVDDTDKSLADLQIQGNPRGTKETNKNQDYLYYKKDQLKQENIAVTYQEDIVSKPISIRAGNVEKTTNYYKTSLTPEIFDKWTIASIPPSDQDFSFDLDFSNKKTVQTKVNFTAINKIPKSDLSYDHSYVSYEDALDVTYTIRAMSVPIIVLGNLTRGGWIIDYNNRVTGKASQTRIVNIGHGETITGAKIVK